jgi:nicotinamidase-related amidase
VVAGVQTPNCIRATAFDAMALDYRVAVLSDATAAKSSEVHEANLFGG